VRGIIFLDGDALPLPGGALAGHLLINPIREFRDSIRH